MRNILRGSLCGGGSGRGRGGEDALANQEDPPPGNTSLEVPGGCSDQQDEPLGNPSTEVRGGGDPLASPTFLIVFPFRPSSGQLASRPTFVVFPVFRQVEPFSIRLPMYMSRLVRWRWRRLVWWRRVLQILIMRNILRGSLCGGGSGRGRGGEDPLANQEDPPPGNTSLEVPGGCSDQQDEPLGNPSTEVRGGGDPLASPTYLLVFPFRPSSGQPASRPTFVVFPVFRQVEPFSIRLSVRLQVRFPSNSHGHAPLSPHRVAIDVPASADVQEDASQVEVEEARLVEEAADTPALDQQDEPLGNPSIEVRGGVRLLVRPQVRFPSYSHGHALLSPHRLAIVIPASVDVQEEASQVEVEEARQVDKARRVEEAADLPAPVEILIMRNILRGSLCGGGSGRGRGSEDPLANQEDPPPGNTSLEVPGGCSDQQDEPLGNPSTEVRVWFPSDSHGHAPLSSHRVAIDIAASADVQEEDSQVEVVLFAVAPVAVAVAAKSLWPTRKTNSGQHFTRVRPQVRFPSYSLGHAPLSPHRVAIDIPSSADVQEEASQMEVVEARQVDEAVQVEVEEEEARQVEEAGFMEFQAKSSYGTKDLWLLLSSVIKTGSDFGTKSSKVYCPYFNTWPHSAEWEMEVQILAPNRPKSTVPTSIPGLIPRGGRWRCMYERGGNVTIVTNARNATNDVRGKRQSPDGGGLEARPGGNGAVQGEVKEEEARQGRGPGSAGGWADLSPF
nr:hypothetical protein Iba_chr10bCG12550 [Ipomoea batatas]